MQNLELSAPLIREGKNGHRTARLPATGSAPLPTPSRKKKTRKSASLATKPVRTSRRKTSTALPGFGSILRKAGRFLYRFARGRRMTRGTIVALTAFGWFAAHVVIELIAHIIIGAPVLGAA